MGKYTAAEVAEALESYTWLTPYKHYKYDYDADRVYTQVLDGEGNPIVEEEGEYESEFSWSEAEDRVGHMYDVLGGVEVVASDPGGEGHGESIWVVIRVKETDQYFRNDGWYASFGEGSVYDGELYEVTPQEKTVVVYE